MDRRTSPERLCSEQKPRAINIFIVLTMRCYEVPLASEVLITIMQTVYLRTATKMLQLDLSIV